MLKLSHCFDAKACKLRARIGYMISNIYETPYELKVD